MPAQRHRLRRNTAILTATALALTFAPVAGAAADADALDEVLPGVVQATGVRPATQAVSPADDGSSRFIVHTTGKTASMAAISDAEVTGAAVSDVYSHVLNGFAAELTPAQVAELEADPDVTSVTPDAPTHAAETQDGAPWGLDRIDQRATAGDGTYSYDTTGSGVTVFVVDSGIRASHAEFAGRASSGWDFVDVDADASDCAGHGTHVAGTIGGETYGVAKDVSLVSLRVWGCNNRGSFSDMIAALDWVVAHKPAGPSVVNISGGGSAYSLMDTAVANTVAAGVPVVVAGMNDNADACTVSPARTAEAISVAATDVSDSRASFSNYGACIDLFAPGVSVLSSTLDSDTSTGTKSGTSMATPHVAGIVAKYQQTNPAADPQQINEAITRDATQNVVSNPLASPNLMAYSAPPSKVITTEPLVLPQNAYVNDVLTVTPGWSPAPITYSYVWKRWGTPIPGQTSPNYTVAGADSNTSLTVTVTGSRAGFPDAVRTSSATTVPTRFQRQGEIWIDQEFIVGTRLEPSSPDLGWIPKPDRHTFQWTRDGVAIPGATEHAYVPTDSDAYSVVRLTQTAYRAGLTPVTITHLGNIVAPKGKIAGTPPTITGDPTIGQKLFAQSSPYWSPSNIGHTFAWYRDGALIENQDDVEYLVTDADAGHRISVAERAQWFDLYEPVAYVSPPVTIEGRAFVLSPTPTISGTTTVGQSLTAEPGTWDAGANLSYQWSGSNGTAIAGATEGTYVLKQSDAGSTITVSVTASKTGHTTTSRTSAPTATIAAAASVSGPIPTITGAVTVGKTVTASAGTWSPAPVALVYQWKRGGIAIAGATSATYTLVAADAGLALTVTVTGSKAGFTSVAKTSAPSTVNLGLMTLMPTPTISGVEKIGSTLTANPGTWDAGVSLSYQWKKNNGNYIVGATAQTYTLKDSDLGATVTVSVTATKPGFSPATKTSATTATITGRTAVAGPVPSITGTPTVGQKLTADAGTWTPAPVALTYQWTRDGASIAGATGSTYTLVAADANTAVTVNVTGTKSGYTPATRTSNAVTVRAASLTLTPTPTISGTLKVGSTLTAITGSWDSGVTLTYQWKKSNGTAISGATGKTYALQGTDAGATLTVSVTGTKPGYSSTTRTSVATSAVAKGTLTAPAPVITGTAKVGQTLIAAPGTWTPAPVSLTYQWKRAGVAITGATKSTYKLVTADGGKAVTVTVTGEKIGYTTVVRTSAPKTVAK